MQYTIAMLGYAEEQETTVLELTYNYGVTEYTKGNAYAQVFICLLKVEYFFVGMHIVFYLIDSCYVCTSLQ